MSYQKLLQAPHEIIPPVIQWCVTGHDIQKSQISIPKANIEKAVSVVQPKLNTQKESSVDDSPLTSKQEEILMHFMTILFVQIPYRRVLLKHSMNSIRNWLPIIAASPT